MESFASDLQSVVSNVDQFFAKGNKEGKRARAAAGSTPKKDKHEKDALGDTQDSAFLQEAVGSALHAFGQVVQREFQKHEQRLDTAEQQLGEAAQNIISVKDDVTALKQQVTSLSLEIEAVKDLQEKFSSSMRSP